MEISRRHLFSIWLKATGRYKEKIRGVYTQILDEHGINSGTSPEMALEIEKAIANYLEKARSLNAKSIVKILGVFKEVCEVS